MSTLVIIESPGKKEKLQKLLGADFEVVASGGHIRDLPADQLGVDLSTFQPQYVVPKKSKRTLAFIQKAARRATRVLLATDPDREGEAIAWHLSDQLRLPNPQRLTFQEITQKAVTRALNSIRPLNGNLVRAQEARRVLDRLVGYRVSPAISDVAGARLSAGRVQSPAVALVVQRDAEIEAFTPVDHFGAQLTFDGESPWTADWLPDLDEAVKHNLDQDLATRAAGITELTVVDFEDTEEEKAPPAPFTTSTLQQAAQQQLKLRPAKCMELAQKLYDAGHITYLRTDSPALSDEALSAIRRYADESGLALPDEPRLFRAKSGAQEAHEAIRPTEIATTPESLSNSDTAPQKAAQDLYALIWARAIASQLAPARYAVRDARLEGGGFSYRARGRTLIDSGWLGFTKADSEPKPQAANPVPALEPGDTVTASHGDVQAKQTKPPKRYTTSTLIRTLEKHGIGRPATYAAIMDNIQERGYIAEDKKGTLSSTALGQKLISLLHDRFAFLDLAFTRALEERLDQIAAGKEGYKAVVQELNGTLDGELERLPKPSSPGCPECGGAMRRRDASKGAFWGCTRYPDCRGTREIEPGGAE